MRQTLVFRFFQCYSIYKNFFFKEVLVMAMKIDAGTCVNCGTCEPECPVSAISEVDGHREINADTCVSCGTCASVCPVNAISEA